MDNKTLIELLDEFGKISFALGQFDMAGHSPPSLSCLKNLQEQREEIKRQILAIACRTLNTY